MADWGLLQGIGQGLQGFGNTITSNAKEELRNKLMIDQENRAEARAIAREERQQAQFGNRAYEQRDGVLWEVDYDKAGRKMDERLAPQNKITAFNNEQQKEKLSLEKLMMETEKLEAEVEWMPEKYRSDAAYRQALIEQSNASRDFTRAGTENRILYGTNSGNPAGSGRTTTPKITNLSETTTKAIFENETKDKEGKTVRSLDKDKWNAWLGSKDYRESIDKNEGAVNFESKWKSIQQMRKDMEADGATEQEMMTVQNAVLNGEEFDVAPAAAKNKQLEGRRQEIAQRGIKAINNARKAIAAGRITLEDARQQLIDAGYPELAKQLR